MPFYVYLLQCSDETFYAGSTSDVPKRVHAHNHTKAGAHYTKIRRPVLLKYVEECETLKEARTRERALKKLSRGAKECLVLDCPRTTIETI